MWESKKKEEGEREHILMGKKWFLGKIGVRYFDHWIRCWHGPKFPGPVPARTEAIMARPVQKSLKTVCT